MEWRARHHSVGGVKSQTRRSVRSTLSDGVARMGKKCMSTIQADARSRIVTVLWGSGVMWEGAVILLVHNMLIVVDAIMKEQAKGC